MKPLLIFLLLCSPCIAQEPPEPPDYKVLYEQEHRLHKLALASKARTDKAFLELLTENQRLIREHEYEEYLMKRAYKIISGMRTEIDTLRQKLDARTWQGGR